MYIFQTPLLTSNKIIFVLFFVFAVVNSVSGAKRLDVDRFCKYQCSRGRGGNLCRCNAFHFVGKKASYKSQGLSTSLESLSSFRPEGSSVGTSSRKYLNEVPQPQLVGDEEDSVADLDAVKEQVRLPQLEYQELLEKFINLMRKERATRA